MHGRMGGRWKEGKGRVEGDSFHPLMPMNKEFQEMSGGMEAVRWIMLHILRI
jgi:hypothetical protein